MLNIPQRKKKSLSKNKILWSKSIEISRIFYLSKWKFQN
jgi:hypothetical protein